MVDYAYLGDEDVSDVGAEGPNPGGHVGPLALLQEPSGLGDEQGGEGPAAVLGLVGSVGLEVEELEFVVVAPPDLGDAQGGEDR